MAPFKRNLILGYSLTLLLLFISSAASYFSISRLVQNTGLLNHTNLVIQKLEHTLSSLKDAETGQRGFLLTGESIFLDPVPAGIENVYKDLNELQSLIAGNQVQELTLIKLNDVAQRRINFLKDLIAKKKDGVSIENKYLREGKALMDEARLLLNQMENREQDQLLARTSDGQKFAERTPLLIFVASLIAILITIISFLRVNSDFKKRTLLQQELAEKDAQINHRIEIISSIADKVTRGDYKVRVDDLIRDELGALSGSLNKMIGSLDHSFSLLSEKEWMQAGTAQVNDQLIGEQTIESIAGKVLDQLVSYTGSNVGGFYYQHNNKLEFITGYAYQPAVGKKILEPGEGLAGQAMVSGKMIALKDIRESDYVISHADTAIMPRNIIALPVVFERTVKAVVVLGRLEPFEEHHKSLLNSIGANIGVGLNTAETRVRLSELLQETQAQSEELAAQHRELEHINVELEAQAEKLKVSEEELKVQQEELMESNSELEERARMLEERNQLIAEQNRDIEDKAAQLQLSVKYKSEFLANMSHELRTPLNSILLLSRLMQENTAKNLSEEQVEYARVIQGSGQGLLSLIDEILDLSRIESGKMELHFNKTAISEIVGNMKALFTPVANERKLLLNIKVDEGLPGHIETDQQRLEQVLKNLLANALKFTSAGSVTLHVKMAGEERIAFEVSDTGIGIAKEKQALIFEAFQQEDGSTRRNYGGTGLGLSISRELASLLGGEITLHSEQGAGSTFSIIIPLKPGTVSEIEKKVLQPVKAVVENGTTTDLKEYTSQHIPESIPDDRDNIEPGDKLILVVEDDTVSAKALLEFTRQNGYKGIVVVRGDEALSLAKKFLPTAILLDIYLPVMSGWEVMDALKADPVTRRIPVHVMSSMEVKTRSISAGAIDFINKPLAAEGMRDIFKKIEQVTNNESKKVLIVEENGMHAKALAYFLESNHVQVGLEHEMKAGIKALQGNDTGCVILDMGMPGKLGYDMLEEVKRTPGLENIPIIVFTGKSLSKDEEMRIKKYADSVVLKTAQSYKRMLDEVSLFLHLVENRGTSATHPPQQNKVMLTDVLNGKKILLVDDDVRNIFSLTKAMEQHHIQVLSAVDGREAIGKLETEKGIQLVLMDMMMPEMDGYETSRHIRTLPQYKNLPIIAVTAKAMSGDREKCLEAGASDYITKPVDTDQLISLLRVWLYDK